jgi:hypothetical protein
MSNFDLEELGRIHEMCKGRFIFFDEKGPGVMMRHDVDDDLFRSLKLAEWQYVQGIKATYFILDTAPYYKGNDPHFWINIRRFQEMGHRVEWHNNAITCSIKRVLNGERHVTPYVHALDILEQFHDNGIPVNGSASHGDKMCYQFKYINYQMFSECQVQSGPMNERVSDLCSGYRPRAMWIMGLNWEAYHVQHDHYYSEPGGAWKKYPEEVNLRDTSNRVQVLIHPQWWKI